MAENYIFKIASSEISGSTSTLGSSLYFYLTPGKPIYFSTDGGLTKNSTYAPQEDIVVLTRRVQNLEVTVYGAEGTPGLVAKVADLELSGTTVNQRLDEIEPVLEATTTTVASLVVDVTELQGLTTRVDNLDTAIIGATTQLQGLTARVDSLDIAVVGATTSIQGLTARVTAVEQNKVPLLVYVTDTASTDVTLDLHGGTYYKFTQLLSGLTFSSIEDSHYESEIRFTGDTVCNVVWPNSTDTQEDLQFEPNKTYIINVRDNLMLATAITPGT